MNTLDAKTKLFSALLLSLVLIGCSAKKDDTPTSGVDQLFQPQPLQPGPVPHPTDAEIPQAPFEIPDSVDLMKLHDTEIHTIPTEQFFAKNRAAVQALYKVDTTYRPTDGSTEKKLPAITPEMAQKLFDSVNLHPVVAMDKIVNYDQPDTFIGYCFGRAMYVHLALLKMGVSPEAIRKAWIIGVMYSQQHNIDWDFHVATVVKTTDGKWMAIDNYLEKPYEVQAWYDHYFEFNIGKDLGIYMTDTKKFTPAIESYNRADMGLDISADADWYRHYFYDMMKWFREHSLTEVGLPQVSELPKDLQY